MTTRFLDIVSTWSPLTLNPLSWVSNSVSFLTKGGPSHVRILLDYDMFWEVTYPRPRFGHISEIQGRREYGRHKLLPFPLPSDLRIKAVEEMLRLNKETEYDVGELAFSHLFDIIGIDNTDQSDRSKFVCSTGLNHIFKTIDFPFGGDLLSPQDIRESIFYEVIPL